jgi:hypothetical protein
MRQKPHPQIRVRIPEDSLYKARTMAAIRKQTLGEYLAALIEYDAEDTFARIDELIVNGDS